MRLLLGDWSARLDGLQGWGNAANELNTYEARLTTLG